MIDLFQKAMRLEDVSEQELREAKENNNHLVLENKDLNTRLKSQKDHGEGGTTEGGREG